MHDSVSEFSEISDYEVVFDYRVLNSDGAHAILHNVCYRKDNNDKTGHFILFQKSSLYCSNTIS